MLAAASVATNPAGMNLPVLKNRCPIAIVISAEVPAATECPPNCDSPAIIKPLVTRSEPQTTPAPSDAFDPFRK